MRPLTWSGRQGGSTPPRPDPRRGGHRCGHHPLRGASLYLARGHHTRERPMVEVRGHTLEEKGGGRREEEDGWRWMAGFGPAFNFIRERG